MEYLCEKCAPLKNNVDLNIFDDYCNKCKKNIRTNDPVFYSKEYQRLYRNKNKSSRLEYLKNYRNDSLDLIKSATKEKGRSRIYICKIGDYRIKIGATCIDSVRLEALEDKMNLAGISFEPLYYFDCRNPDLITEIERGLKEMFCDPEIGLNIDSFKKEMALFSKLKEVYTFIESKLSESGLKYSITEFR